MTKNATRAGSAAAPQHGSAAAMASNRSERVMAYLIVALVALSLASFIAVIVGTSLGAGHDDGFSTGLWPFILVTPLFSLPLAFGLIIVILVLNAMRRSRAAKAEAH